LSVQLAVLDYGMGNLRSVEKALEHVGARAERTESAERARAADGLILPGVGAFPEAMRRLRGLGFDELIRERAEAGVPLLGICLGMQLLFDSSSELEGAPGLGLLPGSVEPLRADGLKVPHIGWSPVSWKHPSALIAGLGPQVPFYFVHSFDPRPAAPGDELGAAEYGARFVCAVERPPLFGVQFHPEKSSSAGLHLLANFASIVAGN
jgi:glutamine amidotransferase